MQLNYRIDGKGNKALFFIHGWASDKVVWQQQVELFKKDYQVITVDLRGHGESPWLDTDNLLKSFSEDILGLCDQLRLRKVNFIVWSMAGFILFELFKRSPELISSATFITCTPKFLNSLGYHGGIEEPNLRLLERKLKVDFNAALEEFRLYMFSQQEKENADFPFIWETLKKIASPHADALRQGLDLLETADFRADLKYINKPALFIAGEDDTIIPKSASQFLQEKVKDSDLAIFKGAGHIPFLTQAEKFNQVLEGWIKKR